MRVLMIAKFAKFAKGERITDARLVEAARAALTNPDATLAGGLVKQRVARQGQGQSGGYRVILAFRHGEQVFFLHGFAKNEADNIAAKVLKTLADAAKGLRAASDEQIEQLLADGELKEIDHDESEDEQEPKGRSKRRRD